MELDYLVTILTKVEVLKVDAQPIRDIIDRFQNGEDLSGLQHLLEVLHTLLATSVFQPNSAPPQILFLLNKIKEGSELKAQAVPVKSVDASNEIIGMLSDLKQEIQSMKNNMPLPGAGASISQDTKTEIKGPLPVFINPISKDVEIKGHITIDSKKGDIVTDKLTKLKNLRRK